MKYPIWFILILICSLSPARAQQVRPEKKDSIPVFRSIGIGLEIRVSCEEQKYQIGWDMSHLDSSDWPKQMLFKGYRFDEADTNRINYRTQKLDSLQLFASPYLWISSPGYYWLEYVDSSKKIHYSSDEVHLELCALFKLPTTFDLGPGKFYRPVFSQNIQSIELVIFDGQGQEVFNTHNPNFKWDGRNMQTAESCPPGTYFYHCDVIENKRGTLIKKNITGIIEISH